jgi:hypothetical protein
VVRDSTIFKTYRIKTLKIFYDLLQKLYKRKRNYLHFLSLNVADFYLYTIVAAFYRLDRVKPLKKTFYYLIVAALYCSFFEDTFARMNPLEAALKQRRLLDQHLKYLKLFTVHLA